MRATHLIHEAAGKPAVPTKYRRVPVTRCAVCAGPALWDLSDLLGDSFTNWASCALPSSTAACTACLFCLKEPALKLGGFAASRSGGLTLYESTAQTVTRLRSPQGKQSAILRCELPPDAAEKCGLPAAQSTPDNSLARVLPRPSFWEALCSPPEPPFALALNTASGMPLPRHMPIVARVATDRGAFPVTYCLDTFEWRPATMVPAHAAGARALREGLWFREVESGVYRNQSLQERRALVRETEAALGPLRGRLPFRLLLDMLPRPKRAPAGSVTPGKGPGGADANDSLEPGLEPEE